MFSISRLHRVAASAAGFGLLSLGASAVAQDGETAAGSLEEVSAVRRQGNVEGVGSQQRVDEFSDETDTLFARYSTTLRQIDAMGVYNHQMRGLIGSQEVELASLEDQLDRVELVGHVGDETRLVQGGDQQSDRHFWAPTPRGLASR